MKSPYKAGIFILIIMRSSTLFCLIVLFAYSAFSQENYQIHGEIGGEGYYATGEELPFWLYHNKFGKATGSTDLSGFVNFFGSRVYNENYLFSFGAKLRYLNDLESRVFVDEAFLYIQNYYLNFTLGAKEKEVLYDGISATNENLIWSNNTRNLPGLRIATTNPIWITNNKKFGFEGSWEEYYLGENRYVDHTLLHHKRLLLVFEPNNKWLIKAGVQHSAQWGGISPVQGGQPTSVKDYLRIITARNGADDASIYDQQNSLGNHLGSYELYVTRKFNYFSLQFLYNSIFEDGSGSRLENFPDGRYGLYFKFKEEDKLVNSIIYEYINLRNQSHLSKFGADNYFNNGPVYKSGYTYNYSVLGVPFITYDKELDQITNNKLTVHHLGSSGIIKYSDYSYPYKFMASYSHNEGTYGRPQLPNGDNQQYMDLFFNLKITNLPVNIGIDLGARFDSFYDPNFGLGLSLSRKF